MRIGQISRRSLIGAAFVMGTVGVSQRAFAQSRSLQDRYGIFYFFAQSCSACKQQSPILRSLADQTGFQVIAISEDGGPCDEFPHYRVDTGQRARMGIAGDETPTLALFDVVTHRAVKISDGVQPADVILHRIAALARTIEKEGR